MASRLPSRKLKADIVIKWYEVLGVFLLLVLLIPAAVRTVFQVKETIQMEQQTIDILQQEVRGLKEQLNVSD